MHYIWYYAYINLFTSLQGMVELIELLFCCHIKIAFYILWFAKLFLIFPLYAHGSPLYEITKQVHILTS